MQVTCIISFNGKHKNTCMQTNNKIINAHSKLKILLNVNEIHSLKITSKSMECM